MRVATSNFITVCRDLELRINNNNSGHGRIVEVCIDDQWHEAIRSAKVASNSQSSQDISIQVDSTSVMVVLSEQSIPNDKTISAYNLLCTTSVLSDGQIHEVKVPNISASATRIQVSGLLPGTPYKCCVSAHILTNTPLDLISSSCIITKTKSLQEASNSLVIGLGTGLGICSLLLVLGILVGFVVSKTRCSKHDSTTQVIMSTNRYAHIIDKAMHYLHHLSTCTQTINGSHAVLISSLLIFLTESQK